ncbi:MAG: RidA family protein [Candidatus Omnitrophica bacterium]|nr:RidA family protein [Candidatus Omnitrophota bacterium]
MEKFVMHTPRLPDAKAAFSRGMKVDLGNVTQLFISGTASVDENAKTAHVGNFAEQVRWTYANIESLLEQAGSAVSDIVKFTVYLKNMEEYERFDELRVEFFNSHGIARIQYPASTCVEARLCRDDLLVEIDAIALISTEK